MGKSTEHWGRHTGGLLRVLVLLTSTTGHSLGWNSVLMTGSVGWLNSNIKRASRCPAVVVRQYPITLKSCFFYTRLIPFLIDGFQLGRMAGTRSTTSTTSTPSRPTTLLAAARGSGPAYQCRMLPQAHLQI
ncbi:hypothetical protein ACB098_01G133500 [Castanea mollissima]|uniref:Secreted protein n=1 Tax=Castanea mollissima TaxID=60419 RepID=A0A8J4RM52_9ROSI|nr:hypothetical protein CMV_000580 [Castanea mollissima]